MMRKPFPRLALLLLLFSCAQVKQTARRQQLPSAIPVLNITNDTTATAISVSSLAIDVKVAANIATTTFDIVFYNPNDRVLEGEFEFPLADGQTIVRYALDMNGQLREGVVVEKMKARVAFENTIRRNIDPGLVEKTKGNNFRTRIYPLPAKGTRHILIAVEEILDMENQDYLYQLPLYTREAIKEFSIKATVFKSDKRPELEQTDFASFGFEKQKDDWTAEYSQKNFVADQTITLLIPNSDKNEDIVLTENYNGQTYFYANSRIGSEYKKKNKPSSIGVLWDISASGEKRDLEKERQLLKEYLISLGDVKVSLIPFNVFTQTKEDFIISSGIAEPLLNRIKQFDYDGGTQFGTIDLSQYQYDEILLFSDGLSTFGKKEIVFSNTPVTTINTSPSADHAYLKFIAQQTHGKFIDFSKLEMKEALNEIANQSLQIVSVEYNKAEIDELVTQISPIQNTGLSFAGKLKTESAEVKVNLGFANEIKQTKTFTITKPESTEYNQVKRIWGSMQVAQLDLQFEKNKEVITNLGKEFSIVTQNTSLIVLDRVEDYVEHEITPPAELLKEYTKLLNEKHKEEKNKTAAAMDEALETMKNLKDWWNKKYTVAKNKQPAELNTTITSDNDEGYIGTDSSVTWGLSFSAPAILADGEAADSSRISRQVVVNNNLPLTYSTDSSVSNYYIQSGELSVQSTAVPFLRTGDGDGRYDRLDSIAGRRAEEEKSTIELNEWKPDVAYLKELEKVSADKRISKYFELKKKYPDQPAFFIDVSRFFIKNGNTRFGIQVLSNVSELKLEDAELLRMVANQLLEANEKELAIETFKEILKIREEEPQSYRDLALAYNETGKYNKALELLYKLITGTWDERFRDVKAIALNEMNAIISAQKTAVNISSVDRRLIYAMPVDVRIVIGWSSDNSDIDLWVTDPRKEKCFYSHNETEMGGKISQDVTQGYGPEEFMLKKAWDGNYIIEANLFGSTRQTLGGPISIKAELFTNFGKPTQKRELINFRVETNKEVVKIGSLKFGS